jgi:DNA-binding MarR family transcriptional regulator
MAAESTPTYRFGDLLALTRQSWLGQMTSRLERLGYADYRRSDAGALRMLWRDPLPVGQLGAGLGVTRQAARKVADALEQRGYATTERDSRDTRQLKVTLTQLGRDYARAITAVIEELNREVAGRVSPSQLAAADAVLRSALFDDSARQRASRLPPPPGQPSSGGTVLAGERPIFPLGNRPAGSRPERRRFGSVRVDGVPG